MPLSNSQTRDVQSILHPYTNLVKFRETGPLTAGLLAAFVFVTAAGSNSGTFVELMFRNSMNSADVSSSASSPPQTAT